MIVKEQKPIEFDNQAYAIFNPEDLVRAIYVRTTKPVCRTKRVFMHGRYPAISIYGIKYHIHRLIAEYRLGRRLDSNESAHHIDDNPLNALWENLKVIFQGDHVRHHLKGRKQDPEFVKRRIAASAKVRWANRIHQNPKLLEQENG